MVGSVFIWDSIWSLLYQIVSLSLWFKLQIFAMSSVVIDCTPGVFCDEMTLLSLSLVNRSLASYSQHKSEIALLSDFLPVVHHLVTNGMLQHYVGQVVG